MVRENDVHVRKPNCIKPFHHVYPCDSKPTTEPKVRGSNPLGCITLSIPIRNTRYLQSFVDLASANNPPKPLLTLESRQHTAMKMAHWIQLGAQER